MKKKYKRNVVAALELTDAETGEQIILPCIHNLEDYCKFMENYTKFATYQPVDEDFVLRRVNNNVKKKIDS